MRPGRVEDVGTRKGRVDLDVRSGCWALRGLGRHGRCLRTTPSRLDLSLGHVSTVKTLAPTKWDLHVGMQQNGSFRPTVATRTLAHGSAALLAGHALLQ